MYYGQGIGLGPRTTYTNDSLLMSRPVTSGNIPASLFLHVVWRREPIAPVEARLAGVTLKSHLKSCHLSTGEDGPS